MSRTIQKIREDLAVLEAQTEKIFEDIYRLYSNYFDLLNQGIKRQLILASYQLCTQIYPDSFLELSFSQRQKLQENLRELAKKNQPQLLNYLEIMPQKTTSPTLNLMEQILLKLPIILEEKSSEIVELEKEIITKINNPEVLIHWIQDIENGITHSLDQLSQQANQTLQEARILPPNLPSKLLEIAIQAEESGAPVTGSPNLLNLLVEAHNKQEDDSEESHQESKITKVTAIHLRLSEIEFAEPTVSIKRQQIRQQLEKIRQLRQQYSQKERELATAEAESAWRASWYED